MNVVVVSFLDDGLAEDIDVYRNLQSSAMRWDVEDWIGGPVKIDAFAYDTYIENNKSGHGVRIQVVEVKP